MLGLPSHINIFTSFGIPGRHGAYLWGMSVFQSMLALAGVSGWCMVAVLNEWRGSDSKVSSTVHAGLSGREQYVHTNHKAN